MNKPCLSISHRILWAGAAVALTAIGGFIRIPFVPVPLTLQTCAVYLSGAILGARTALMSQTVFLLLGLSGAPVFTLGGGPGYVLQPTFGYLASFPLAAGLIGLRVGKRLPAPDVRSLLAAFIPGMGVIHLCGVLVLYLNLKYIAGHPVSWAAAAWSGSLVLLPGELIKMAAAAMLTVRILPRLQGFMTSGTGG
ncbi:MAG TPA: biotin transporter BioY [bacterium]|mgnify:CR=1 FL=1|nr:biotin transporter BioY [bacterium]